MAAGRYSFVIEQGATVDFDVVYKDTDGNKVDFTAYTAAMQIRDTAGGSTLHATLTSSLSGLGQKNASSSFISLSGSNLSMPLASGSIGIYMGHAVTNDLDFDEGYYDLEITSGSIRTRLLQGKVQFSKQVTTV